jgi:hypothetical protein
VQGRANSAGSRFEIADERLQFAEQRRWVVLITLDDFHDGRAGDGSGGSGGNGLLHLTRLRDAKALQRRRSMIFAQLLDQMMQRQAGAPVTPARDSR